VPQCPTRFQQNSRLLHITLNCCQRTDAERGLGGSAVAIEPAALEALVNLANGDARIALSTLEFAAAAAPETGFRPRRMLKRTS